MGCRILFNRLKYAFTLKSVRQLQAKGKHEDALLMLDDLVKTEKNYFVISSYVLKSLFEIGRKSDANVEFERLVKFIIKGVDEGIFKKSELLWIIDFCYNKYGFRFKGISDIIDVDEKKNYPLVRIRIRDCFDLNSL